MPIIKLIIEGSHCWLGDEPEAKYPCMNEVMMAVECLDGHECTYLHLDHEDGSSLSIGGGPDAFYVYLCNKQSHFHMINHHVDHGTSVELVMGGQMTDMPSRLCVNRTTVVDVVVEYFRAGAAVVGDKWQSCKDGIARGGH